MCKTHSLKITLFYRTSSTPELRSPRSQRCAWLSHYVLSSTQHLDSIRQGSTDLQTQHLTHTPCYSLPVTGRPAQDTAGQLIPVHTCHSAWIQGLCQPGSSSQASLPMWYFWYRVKCAANQKEHRLQGGWACSRMQRQDLKGRKGMKQNFTQHSSGFSTYSCGRNNCRNLPISQRLFSVLHTENHWTKRSSETAIPAIWAFLPGAEATDCCRCWRRNGHTGAALTHTHSILIPATVWDKPKHMEQCQWWLILKVEHNMHSPCPHFSHQCRFINSHKYLP